jgi:non-ribosomal peptide synthetase component F
MVLLAGFEVLLHAYVQQDDLVVGTNVANRNRLETEALIGFFINQLVLRTDLSGNPTFRELLGQIREVSLEAYAHQDLPFDRLVEELQPERDPSRSLLFQVKFELQNAPMSPLSIPGLTVSPVEIDRRVVRYDLHVTLSDGAAGIGGAALYSAELFEEATIVGMMEAFVGVLSSAVAAPDTRLSELEQGIAEAEQRARSLRRELRKKQNLDGLKQAQRRAVEPAPAAEPAVTE